VIVKIDAANGREQWRFVLDGYVTSSPAVIGGVIYVGTLKTSVQAIGGSTASATPRAAASPSVGASGAERSA
jgi:hypothetical protein